MQLKFSSSLRGYDLGYIKELVQKIDDEYTRQLKSLEDEFFAITRDMDELEKQRDALKEDTSSIDKYEREIGSALYKSYMKACGQVLAGEKKARVMETQMLNQVCQYEEEYKNLQITLDRLVAELKEKVGQYKSELGVTYHGNPMEKYTV